MVPDEELLDAARTVAQRIAANPPNAVRMTKRLLKIARTAGLAELLEVSAAMQALAHTTNDNREVVDAFLNKRQPSFNGT